jgi:hypothetical protein
VLSAEGDFYDVVEAHLDKSLRVFVYSADFQLSEQYHKPYLLLMLFSAPFVRSSLSRIEVGVERVFLDVSSGE